MSQKNLLFIFADQWRGSALGYAKSDPVITPNMDRFCEEAVYCSNAYSTFPLCSPHRASLLTGRYPLSTGVFTNCKTGLSMRLGDEEVGIGQVLKAQGYETAYIGKWHLDEPEENHKESSLAVQEGCQDVLSSGARGWDAYTPPGVRRHGFDFWYSYGAWDAHLEPHYWKDSPKMIEVQQWSPEHETDVAIDYIRKRTKKPFALYLSWNPPHSPYAEVPEKYRRLYGEKKSSCASLGECEKSPCAASGERSGGLRPNVTVEAVHHHTGEAVPCTEEELAETTKQYYSAITGLDDQFGRLMEELKRQGLYEDTVVVLSSDHGDMMGSHGLMGKHVWYDEAVKIPLVIRYPGSSPRVCNTCIGSQDIMPTVLGMLDLSVPEAVEGVDCSPAVLRGEEALDKPCFLCACPGRTLFLDAFEQAGKNPIEAGWRGVRTGRYTYVLDTGYGVEWKLERHLYDNQADIYQQQELNLEIPDNRIIAERLEAMIISRMKEYKDNFRLLQ